MWRPSLSSSERSKSISRLTPARRAADKSIGFGRANIDWPDLLPRLVMILSHYKNEDAYCRTIFASRPNWSTLRVMRSNVSKISSSLLVVPQPAKRITSNVNTQNTVTTRSKTLKGCFQNCCPSPAANQLNVLIRGHHITHAAESKEADRHFRNHCRVDNDLQDVECEAGATLPYAKYHSRY